VVEIFVIVVTELCVYLCWLHREELQEAQWQAAKANMVPCHNCQRRFAPDRIAVHERVCKGPKKPPPTIARDTHEDEEIAVKGQYRVNFDKVDRNSNPDDASRNQDAVMRSSSNYKGKYF